MPVKRDDASRRRCLAYRVAPRLGVTAVVDLVEDDQRAPVLGPHPVAAGVRRDLGVGDDDTVEVGTRDAGGVAEPRVEGQPHPRRRLRPLELEVLGRGDDGHRLDRPVGEEFARDPEAEGGLARPGRRDGEEVTGPGGEVFRQSAPLPGPQRPAGVKDLGLRNRELLRARGAGGGVGDPPAAG